MVDALVEGILWDAEGHRRGVSGPALHHGGVRHAHLPHQALHQGQPQAQVFRPTGTRGVSGVAGKKRRRGDQQRCRHENLSVPRL
jgi:hypothetical protein